MAGWRDSYRSASFRGVPFFVSSTDSEYARRGQHHEFPQRDRGYFEDLGDADPSFSFEAYVTENLPGGYMDARDKLVAACRTPGLGELVHPYRGSKRVVCTRCVVRESVDDGGVARFQLSFLESGERESPAARTDHFSAISAVSDTALDVGLDDFADTFSVAGFPQFVSDAASLDIGSALDDLQAACPSLSTTENAMGGFLRGALNMLDMATSLTIEPVSFLWRTVSMSRLGLSGLLGDAMGLGYRLAGLMRLLSPAAGSYDSAFSAQRSLWDFSLTATSATTPSRTQQAANTTAVAGLIRQCALIESARLTPLITLATRDEAVQLREELADRLDDEAGRASDPVYAALQDVRSATVSALSSRAPQLSQVSSFVPSSTMSSLVAAYEVYGDCRRASDIVQRNHVRHPGFLPGGQPLEVLRG